jgi:conjugal transfer mating pair stabilization protein TraN
MTIIRSLLTGLLALALMCANVQAQTYAAGACSPVPDSQQCIDAQPCKTLSDGTVVCLAGTVPPAGGLNVPQTCWQYSYAFACSPQGAGQDTCKPYREDASCSVVRQTCADTVVETGRCAVRQFVYSCSEPAPTVEKTVCTSGLFQTEPTPSVVSDPMKAILASELARQSQQYSDQGKDIFKGEAESCQKGYLGIKNCCRPNPGARNNAQMTNAILKEGASVVKYVGEKAVDWASPYVFDAMYNSGIWTDAMSVMFSQGASEFSSGTLGTDLASGGFSFGVYGLTFSSQLATGAIELTTTQFGVISFDPTSFAINLAIQVLQRLMSCSPAEEQLAMHRGANLSFYVRTSCAKRFLGSCLAHRDHYCSFNSVLSKIINQQGKPQLGLDLSDCSGLTVEQISKLDFSKIDFGEFLPTLQEQSTRNLPSDVKGNYTPVMQNKQAGSAQGVPALPSYPPTGP